MWSILKVVKKYGWVRKYYLWIRTDMTGLEYNRS